MFEQSHIPVISRCRFIWRMAKSAGLGLLFVCLSLGSGVAGYRYFEGMSWTDAFLNAAMIASGMGPVDAMKTDAGKIFAGFYAIYSGLFLIAVTGFFLAPVVHRVMHKFHYKV